MIKWQGQYGVSINKTEMIEKIWRIVYFMRWQIEKLIASSREKYGREKKRTQRTSMRKKRGEEETKCYSTYRA